MRTLKRVIGSERRLVVWAFGIGFYVLFQALLYGQGTSMSTQQATDTPWEHLTLEGGLALAVAVQYRENRGKETEARQLAAQAAAQIEKATGMMADVTRALERLSNKIDECPAKEKGFNR